MFVDHVRVYAKAGDGGHGCVSFRRAKYLPKGGPDGGDGGDGGDVIFEVDHHVDSLREFFYRPNLKAKKGQPGSGNNRTGRSGQTLTVKVPAGTVIYRSDEDPHWEPPTDEDGLRVEGVERPQPNLSLVADLTEVGERLVLARGGKGGKGNSHFKSATNRAPRECTPGEEGEEGYFFLELRRIADAGFVGFPNAGKSTLLNALSNARPKIASYPFTTLQPMVGVVEFSGFARATLADIPGLIEGAHENVGLGHDFLRHIMRCSLLLFVVDMAGSEGRVPGEDVAKLRTEISLYDRELAGRPWLVIANKMDLPESEENLSAFRLQFPKVEIIPVSAETGLGLDTLRERLRDLLASRPD